jgi:transcriptional regulator with XRE-family HTH domain
MLKQFLRERDFMTAPTIGERLKDIRISRNLSLDEVSRLAGVSKPMLGQIERGQSIPTITTLWKIATGLKTPLSFFLEGQQAEYTIVSPDQANVILGDNGKMRAYPLFTYDPVRSVETFYIEFDPDCRHSSDKHNDGVEEHIFVLRGMLRLVLGDKTVDVGERQAVRFRADMPHAYQNLSESACAVYNTIFYPSR